MNHFLSFKDTLVAGILNWQTTILGTMGLIYAIIEHIDVLTNGNIHDGLEAMLPSVGVFLLALFAKDAGKTGVAGQDEFRLR